MEVGAHSSVLRKLSHEVPGLCQPFSAGATPASLLHLVPACTGREPAMPGTVGLTLYGPPGSYGNMSMLFQEVIHQ